MPLNLEREAPILLGLLFMMINSFSSAWACTPEEVSLITTSFPVVEDKVDQHNLAYFFSTLRRAYERNAGGIANESTHRIDLRYLGKTINLIKECKLNPELSGKPEVLNGIMRELVLARGQNAMTDALSLVIDGREIRGAIRIYKANQKSLTFSDDDLWDVFDYQINEVANVQCEPTGSALENINVKDYRDAKGKGSILVFYNSESSAPVLIGDLQDCKSSNLRHVYSRIKTDPNEGTSCEVYFNQNGKIQSFTFPLENKKSSIKKKSAYHASPIRIFTDQDIANLKNEPEPKLIDPEQYGEFGDGSGRLQAPNEDNLKTWRIEKQKKIDRMSQAMKNYAFLPKLLPLVTLPQNKPSKKESIRLSDENKADLYLGELKNKLDRAKAYCSSTFKSATFSRNLMAPLQSCITALIQNSTGRSYKKEYRSDASFVEAKRILSFASLDQFCIQNQSKDESSKNVDENPSSSKAR